MIAIMKIKWNNLKECLTEIGRSLQKEIQRLF